MNDNVVPYISAIPFSAIELEGVLVKSCFEYYFLGVLQLIYSFIPSIIDSVWPQPVRFHLLPFLPLWLFLKRTSVPGEKHGRNILEL